jgi:alpha-L-fucosidase 2
MNNLTKILLCFPLVAAGVGAMAQVTNEPVPGNPLVLWYQQPAQKWTEALPVGNGRISAMVFGGVDLERLQLNEGTLWAGGPYDPVNPQAKDALPQVRQLINDGKYQEAAGLIKNRVLAMPVSEMPYQTVGDLLLTFAGATNVASYRRDLDLDTATATVSYIRDSVRYTRAVFADAPDNVIVVRLTADQPGRISFSAGLRTPMKATVETNGIDTLVMRGVGGDSSGIKGQLKYEARVKVIATRGGGRPPTARAFPWPMPTRPWCSSPRRPASRSSMTSAAIRKAS